MTIAPTLERIAQQHLGLATLKPRSSDALDFHDVSVWSLEAALKAAFEAGQNTPTQAAGQGNKCKPAATPAAAGYAAHLEAVEALLKEIQLGIQGHAQRAAQEPGNWGFAGDMGYYQNLLADVRDGLFGRVR